MKTLLTAAKVIVGTIIIVWGFCWLGSCMVQDNVNRRNEQRKDCIMRGGSYSESQDPSGNPFRDSCIVK